MERNQILRPVRVLGGGDGSRSWATVNGKDCKRIASDAAICVPSTTSGAAITVLEAVTAG